MDGDSELKYRNDADKEGMNNKNNFRSEAVI